MPRSIYSLSTPYVNNKKTGTVISHPAFELLPHHSHRSEKYNIIVTNKTTNTTQRYNNEIYISKPGPHPQASSIIIPLKIKLFQKIKPNPSKLAHSLLYIGVRITNLCHHSNKGQRGKERYEEDRGYHQAL